MTLRIGFCMKKLFCVLGFLFLGSQIDAMDSGYQKSRLKYLACLPTYVKNAQWNMIVQHIQEGHIIASDLTQYKEQLCDQSPQPVRQCSLFQQMIDSIRVTSDQNHVQRLQRALQALIVSNIVNHSEKLALETPATNATDRQSCLQIYTAALAEVQQVQQHIAKEIGEKATERLGHYVSFQLIDPIFLKGLPDDQKEEFGQSIIQWATGNRCDQVNIALVIRSILLPNETTPLIPSVYSNRCLSIGAIAVGVAFIGALYYFCTINREQKVEDQETEFDQEVTQNDDIK